MARIGPLRDDSPSLPTGGCGSNGSTDIFEVVECSEDRDTWVETNPAGTSDDCCDMLYEFFVDTSGEVVFVDTSSSTADATFESAR